MHSEFCNKSQNIVTMHALLFILCFFFFQAFYYDLDKVRFVKMR